MTSRPPVSRRSAASSSTTHNTGFVGWSSRRVRAIRPSVHSSTVSSGAVGSYARFTARAYAGVWSRPGIRSGAYCLITVACAAASAASAKCSSYFDLAAARKFRWKKPSAPGTSSSEHANSGCILRVPASDCPMNDPLTNSRWPGSSWLGPAFSPAWRSSAPSRARGDDDGSGSSGPGMAWRLPIARYGLSGRSVWPGWGRGRHAVW
ncbi:hypothetical protein SUDANB6_03314 [Streptomyces sp. enrichment culture]